MKALIIFSLLLISSFTFGQTKQISHKSHSGNTENFKPNDYTDNFGLDESMLFIIEKVKYIKKNCVVEYRTNYRKEKKSDTICDHPYFSGQYTFEEIKSFYPEDTKFEGFEGEFFNNSTIKPKNKKNYNYWIFICLIFGTGTFLIFKPTFLISFLKK